MANNPLDLEALAIATRRQQAGAHQRPDAPLHAHELRTLAMAACLPGYPDDVRESAVNVLAWYHDDPAVMRLLLDLCADPCPQVRWLASAIHWNTTPAVRPTIVHEFEPRTDIWDEPNDTIGPVLEVIGSCGAPVLTAFWMGLKDERDQHVCTWLDSGGHYDHLKGLASVAASAESTAAWRRLGTHQFCELSEYWRQRRDPELRAFVLHLLEDIDDIDHYISPDMLVHDVECLLLHWRDVDALPLVRRLVQSNDERSRPWDHELADAMTTLLERLEALAADRAPPPILLDGPLAPWSSPPSTPSADAPRVEGWRWFDARSKEERTSIQAKSRATGWEEASVAATIRGLRVFWPHPTMTRSMERALAWCGEELEAQVLCEEAPASPFVVDGEVTPAWTAWLLSQVHTRLPQRSDQEYERWLTWMIFTLHAPHRALAQRFEAVGQAELSTSDGSDARKL